MNKIIFIKAVSLLLSVILVFSLFTGCTPQENPVNNDQLDEVGADAPTEEPAVLNRANITRGFTLTPGIDYTVTGKTYDEICTEITLIFDQMKSSYFNSVFVSLLADGKAYFKSNVIDYATDFEEDIVKFIYDKALEKGFYIYFIFDINQYSSVDPIISNSDFINIIGNLVNTYVYLSGILYSDFSPTFDSNISKSYITSGGTGGIENHKYSLMTKYINNVIGSTKKFSSKIFAGVLYDGNLAVENDSLHFSDYCHISDWLNKNVTDFACIKFDSAKTEDTSFFDLWLNTAEPTENQKYIQLDSNDQSFYESYSKAVKNKFDGIIVTNIDELLSNTDTWGKLKELDSTTFGGISENERNTILKIYTPSDKQATSDESFYFISGGSDPLHPVYINNTLVETDNLGNFSHRVELKSGDNTFTVKHKDFTENITIKYSFQLIRSVSPTNIIYLNGSSKLTVTAVCVKGAAVTATLNSQTITLNQSQSTRDDSSFTAFSGTFTMPDATDRSQNLGSITFKATYSGQSASRNGSTVYINKTSGIIPEINEDFNYTNTSGKVDYILRVEREQIETFNGNTSDNRSRSVNAYLPKGTLDYCASGDSHLSEAGDVYYYRLMNYGKRVYTRTETNRGIKDDYVSIFYGSLPDYNSMSVAGVSNNSRHTYITLNSEWKAPFNVTLAPQEYLGINNIPAEYDVETTTYEYIDFSFAYCTNATGSIDLSNDPVFTHSEWIKNTNGEYTLRLHLRRTGMFYGWSASYNANGQLVLGFLNPVKITPAANSYGYSLENTVIMLDPGHGGKGDSGATGFATNKNQYECALNLVLALKVKNILESLGATVIMTRTTDTQVTLDTRNSLTRQYKPDIFISFHRNGSTSDSLSGYSVYYYQPFSMQLAKEIATRCNALRRGSNQLMNYSPPMQVCRVSDCPSILTENWFVTNKSDFNMIITDAFNNKNAEATVKGIIAYFKYIQ